MSLVVYTDSLYEEHDTPGDHPECPERARAVIHTSSSDVGSCGKRAMRSTNGGR